VALGEIHQKRVGRRRPQIVRKMTDLLFCSFDWLTGKLFNRERENDAVDGWSFVAIDNIGVQLEKRQ
jgi:hypothetical protein